jgi:hypothetical protein
MSIIAVHECKKSKDDFPGVEETPDLICYGPIIHGIEKTKTGWIAHNDEYASYIKFCPFCGEKLS